jgi:hypothetical protein
MRPIDAGIRFVVPAYLAAVAFVAVAITRIVPRADKK